jgi:hypothetical protein
MGRASGVSLRRSLGRRGTWQPAYFLILRFSLFIAGFSPTSPSVGGFRVQCGPSLGHALSEILSLFISLELLDEHSEAVRITYAGCVPTATLDWSSIESAPLQELFKGVYNRSSVEERLKQMLYSLLDKAEQVQRRPEDGGALGLSNPARSKVRE